MKICLYSKKKIAAGVVMVLVFLQGTCVDAGSLTCTLTTQAACTGVVVLNMSSTSNATAELPSQSNYINNVVCCSGVTGLSNSCSGVFQQAVKLSSVTNAHVEENTLSNYTNPACIAVSVGHMSVGYQNSNCSGFDTTLFSISSSTNAHVGTSTAYTRKVCGTADNIQVIQAISFSISTSTAYFGTLSSIQSRYASSTGQGDSAEVEAHTLTASSSGPYQIYVQGASLTSLNNSSNTISPIGAVNTVATPGVEQFGIRVATTSGNGAITSTYSGAGFGYNASATTTDLIATSTGDGISTVYSVRYVANINSVTEAGSYYAKITYVVVASF